MSDRASPTLTATTRPWGPPLGRLEARWRPRDGEPLRSRSAEVAEGLRRLGEPVWVVQEEGGPALACGGTVAASGPGHPVLAFAPPMPPQALGDPTFAATHRLRFNYVAGAMANGIASVELVQAMAQAGMLGFFGAAGLPAGEVEAAIRRLQAELLDAPFGANLIHSPYEPELEEAVTSVFLGLGVTRVSASAYTKITESLVRYRLHGVHERDGRIVAPNHVFAKISRLETAQPFFSPPPEPLVRALVAKGLVTEHQAMLARRIPMACEVTAEADSGGHTDNRPAVALLPSIVTLRDAMQRQYGGAFRLRVGGAGGLGTPHAIAAAFAMGADYVLTGSVNQACVEAGTSEAVRNLLAAAGPTDVTMAPAADMFEMGVQLQVLRRGTLFPARARKLWELYQQHARWEDIPAHERRALEAQVFRAPIDAIWERTREFWRARDPGRLARAEADPKRRMALLFRWYLGMSSRWANAGDPERVADYQVWCGPAMGAFNEWTQGSFLASPSARRAGCVALNLLHGAAVLTRVHLLRAQGIAVDPNAVDVSPRPVADLENLAA